MVQVFTKEEVSVTWRLVNEHDIGYYMTRYTNNETSFDVLQRILLF